MTCPMYTGEWIRVKCDITTAQSMACVDSSAIHAAYLFGAVADQSPAAPARRTNTSLGRAFPPRQAQTPRPLTRARSRQTFGPIRASGSWGLRLLCSAHKTAGHVSPWRPRCAFRQPWHLPTGIARLYLCPTGHSLFSKRACSRPTAHRLTSALSL